MGELHWCINRKDSATDIFEETEGLPLETKECELLCIALKKIFLPDPKEVRLNRGPIDIANLPEGHWAAWAFVGENMGGKNWFHMDRFGVQDELDFVRPSALVAMRFGVVLLVIGLLVLDYLAT